MKYQLAQINIAKLIAPIDDPLIADFVAQLDGVNKKAEESKGFVWRLKDNAGESAITISVFDDPNIIVNMSVWDSVEDLKNFTYKTMHVDVFIDRAKWFEKMTGPHLAMWWIQEGAFPSDADGKQKIMYLEEHGPTAEVFTFKNITPPPTD